MLVPVAAEAFLRQFLGNDASVREIIHYLIGFHIYLDVVGGFLCKVVVGDHVLWEVAEFEAHIFTPSHKGVQTEVLYVDCCDCCEFFVGRGDNDVE